ncbi:putative chorismate pyruvate-lyase [Thalassotalea loyana]|uniref:Probable chorismate pyruvate-lyase n=1 Tax=Thalassotalea loyana TaxID=280483 RepID=A0ABQ6HAN9_9GAMM|nr:chorismate lyase [Thalassotalea loyana]GLX83837.1 putative chorismate pyruvate-lyase [Thalassotalea loyana]
MSSLQHLFPINLSADWQNQVPEGVNTYVKDWLLDESSLTARLKANAREFRLEVLGQQITYCSEQEACIYVKAGERVLAREVVLFCDDVPQVFARSLLPLTSLTGEQKALAELGEQPLGQVIFNSPLLQRKALQVAEFSEASNMHSLNVALNIDSEQSYWGRRSTFLIDDKPILVAEVFLPGALAYQQG